MCYILETEITMRDVFVIFINPIEIFRYFRDGSEFSSFSLGPFSMSRINFIISVNTVVIFHIFAMAVIFRIIIIIIIFLSIHRL